MGFISRAKRRTRLLRAAWSAPLDPTRLDPDLATDEKCNRRASTSSCGESSREFFPPYTVEESYSNDPCARIANVLDLAKNKEIIISEHQLECNSTRRTIKVGGLDITIENRLEARTYSTRTAIGNVGEIKITIDRDLNLLSLPPEYFHQTMMSCAALKGHMDIVEILIGTPGVNMRIPLLLAARNGHVKVFEFLLEHSGADLDSRDMEFCTQLLLASKNGLQKMDPFKEYSGILSR